MVMTKGNMLCGKKKLLKVILSSASYHIIFNKKYVYGRTSRGSGEAFEKSRMERRQRNGVNSVTGEA